MANGGIYKTDEGRGAPQVEIVPSSRRPKGSHLPHRHGHENGPEVAQVGGPQLGHDAGIQQHQAQRAAGGRRGPHQRVMGLHPRRLRLWTPGKTVGTLHQDVPGVEVRMDEVVHEYLEGDQRYSRQSHPSPPHHHQAMCKKASKVTGSAQGLSTRQRGVHLIKAHCLCHAFRICTGIGQVDIIKRKIISG